jgi:hypothetical protein
MHDEFFALTKTLNVPLLSEDDITALNRLQKQWEHWMNRERQHAPPRIAEEQQAAFDAFLDNPTGENEQRMIVLADANLTGTRYALLRRACAALRGRISAQAAQIVRPALDRALDVLNAEHDRRREAAEPVLSSKDRNPTVIEVRRAIDFADKLAHRAYTALTGSEGAAPLVLADELIGGAHVLTSEVGK